MQITRSSDLDGSRYAYDTGECSAKNGYAQIDTTSDASYYGNWASPSARTIVSFAEGDVCRTICESDEEFTREVQRFADYDPEDFIGIDAPTDTLAEAFRSLGLGHLLHSETI